MRQEHEIICAGFGGRECFNGSIIAYSGMIEGKEVSWMPSYGPEMRGGTANCIVIVSDARISSPIITKFDSAIVLNQPSLDKFEKAVKPEDCCCMNSQRLFTLQQEKILISSAFLRLKRRTN